MRSFYLRLTLLFAFWVLVLGGSNSYASNGAYEPKTYVLSAGQWEQNQNNAVNAAGGTIVFSHRQTGIAVITSDNPNFLDQMFASGTISGGAEDVIIQWQPPVREVMLEENAVTPGDETFANAQWNIRSINAPQAWATGVDGAGVRVAVIDGGIHSAHVDLDGNLDVARSRSFVPGFNFNQDVGTFWHGTHVAGIIAAEDNAIGTIGVAPRATLIGVKALHNGSGSFSAIINAVLYASTPIAEGGGGADIINMSLGATLQRGGGNTGIGQLIASLNRAVNYASSNGVLVVTSAGNDALDLDHSGNLLKVPAMSGTALAVSATGPTGYAIGFPNGATNFRTPAYYTNFGNSLVNIAGPGGNSSIFGTPAGNAPCSIPRISPPGTFVNNPCWVFDMVMSTVRGSGASVATYSWAEGTSMAAPAVSGVAALIKQRNPGISLGALKNKLLNSADDEGPRGHDPFYGRGYVNAFRAVQ